MTPRILNTPILAPTKKFRIVCLQTNSDPENQEYEYVSNHATDPSRYLNASGGMGCCPFGHRVQVWDDEKGWVDKVNA